MGGITNTGIVIFDEEGDCCAKSWDVHHNDEPLHLDGDTQFILGDGKKISAKFFSLHMKDRNRVEAVLDINFQCFQCVISKMCLSKQSSYQYIVQLIERVSTRDSKHGPDDSSLRSLSSLVKKIPAVLFQYELRENNRGFFSYLSPQVRSIFGIIHHLSTNNTQMVLDKIYDEDRLHLLETIKNSQHDFTDWKCEFRIKKGTLVRWIYGYAIPIHKNNLNIWCGVFIDISDKKHLEFKLIKESTVDPLTGVYNRRYFIGRLQDELKECEVNSQTHTSLLIFDFDCFKQVNDQYGHDAGDKMLQNAVELISKNIRKTDCFARMGGDEFDLILPDTDYATALNIAEKLRCLIEHNGMTYQGSQIKITITIGVSSTDQGHKGGRDLMRSADRALYLGKESGRNCVR